MKFKRTIIAILALLLIVNAVGIGLIIKEEREQTTIALKTAELISIQSGYRNDEILARIRRELGLQGVFETSP